MFNATRPVPHQILPLGALSLPHSPATSPVLVGGDAAAVVVMGDGLVPEVAGRVLSRRLMRSGVGIIGSVCDVRATKVPRDRTLGPHGHRDRDGPWASGISPEPTHALAASIPNTKFHANSPQQGAVHMLRVPAGLARAVGSGPRSQAASHGPAAAYRFVAEDDAARGGGGWVSDLEGSGQPLGDCHLVLTSDEAVVHTPTAIPRSRDLYATTDALGDSSRRPDATYLRHRSLQDPNRNELL